MGQKGLKGATAAAAPVRVQHPEVGQKRGVRGATAAAPVRVQHSEWDKISPTFTRTASVRVKCGT